MAFPCPLLPSQLCYSSESGLDSATPPHTHPHLGWSSLHPRHQLSGRAVGGNQAKLGYQESLSQKENKKIQMAKKKKKKKSLRHPPKLGIPMTHGATLNLVGFSLQSQWRL